MRPRSPPQACSRLWDSSQRLPPAPRVFPRPHSPYRFTGTVTEVENADRTATVVTDEGRTVTVIGSEASPNAASTVGRTYQIGVRYEFHPLNTASPAWTMPAQPRE